MRSFAGGAVIAKQQSDNSIEWRTSDPVTGTTGIFGYSSGGSTFYTEETEPLGQHIHPHDPTEADGPLPGQIFFGSADEPEWKCEEKNAVYLYGGFTGRPIGCQLATANTQAPFNEPNPQHVDPDNPDRAPDKISASFRMMSVALRSTTKFNIDGDDDETPIIIIPTRARRLIRLPADLEERFSAEYTGTDSRPVSERHDAKFDPQKLKDCTKKLFGVDAGEFTGDQVNGKYTFNGTWDDNSWSAWWFEIFSFGAYESVHTFTITTSTDKSAITLRYDVMGVLASGAIVKANTRKEDPLNNDIASDFAAKGEFTRSLWVYELGNALGYITGAKPPVEDPGRYSNASLSFKDDIGGALEDCVYGGAVNEHGVYEPPRPVSQKRSRSKRRT